MVTALSAIEAARRAAEVAADKQASDVLVLDLCPLHAFTDFFVLLTGTSPPHLDALAEEIEKALGQGGRFPLHREGDARSGWMVLDYGDVVVHIFLEEKRAYYRLEERWKGAVPLLMLP